MSVALSLVFVLAQTGIPSECAPQARASSENVWERAKSVDDRAYCERVAAGLAKLSMAGGAASQEVLRVAEEALVLRPDGVASHVLKGRAYVREGNFDRAYGEFMLVRTAKGDPLGEPAALLAWARTLRAKAKASEAREAFRKLLPMASSLSPRDRPSAWVVAAFAAMEEGPSGLDDALAIFRQARRSSVEVEPIASLGLGLALDRRGSTLEANAALSSVQLLNAPEMVERWGKQLTLEPSSRVGLLALALETKQPKEARRLWLTITDGPWAEHARAKARTK